MAVDEEGILASILEMKNGASESFGNFPKVTQLVSITARTLLCVASKCSVLFFSLVAFTLHVPGQAWPGGLRPTEALDTFAHQPSRVQPEAKCPVPPPQSP